MLVDTFNIILRLEQAALNRSGIRDLSINEIHTIGAIGREGGKSMSDVAAAMQLGLPTMTAIIDKLEQKGYVQRKRTPEDRRVVLISLTHNGLCAERLHSLYHKRMLERAMEGVSPDEEDSLIATLSRLNDFFRNNECVRIEMEENE